MNETLQRSLLSRVIVILAGISTIAPPCRAEPMLIEGFERKLDPARLKTQDAEVTLVKESKSTALRIDLGHKSNWPGITIVAPKGKWDLSAWRSIAIDVRNVGTKEVTLCCRVDNPGANGWKNCNTFQIKLAPGKSGTLAGSFIRKGGADVKLIGMRGYPPEAGGNDTRAIDLQNVTQILLFSPKPKSNRSVLVDNITATEPYKAPKTPAKFLPMIDEFGQYMHRNWPGKTASAEDMKASAAAESKDIGANPGPKDRNEFGGWTGGPQLKATGWFRTEKHAGKWWLVDPKGRLFWSHGIDCVHSRAATPISNREHYFRNLPGAKSMLSKYYGKGSWAPHGYYKDHSPYRTYDFARANLRRKYDDRCATIFAAITHKRLRSWGMNTIANWSDSRIYLMRKTPYVGTIHTNTPKLEGSKGYWGKFHDVFDPEFARAVAKGLAREKGKSANDPMCIGYFVDNELAWGDDVSLALAALVSGPDQPAKKAFIADLKAKYSTIDKLNSVWAAKYKSWGALLASRTAPDKNKARADLRAFYTKTAETYFRIVRDEVKKVAPNQLYLGCRFAWVNDLAAKAAAKYCDVVCYNRYKYSVEDLRIPGNLDKPIVIGEFHFGALDRGMFHTGLRKARNQKHRAELYAAYVRGALRNPLIVGTHWFQYKDQATTGRGDGENYQIGFVDICDTPYPEIIEAARSVGYKMYEYRLKTASPAKQP
ncbi:MAG: beta-galactosidase [Phycisphaerae bacterium]|jgi:hypothetical protein|nr:beta-galactosidase [Phycisphaerae bacterium]